MAVTNTQQTQFTCPECNGTLVEDTGETYCEGCGLVLEDAKMNYQTESYHPDGGVYGRETSTHTMHDNGLGSQISFKNTDSEGRRVTGKSAHMYDRLRDLQTSYQWSKKEQNNRQGLGEVRRMVSVMDLDKSELQLASKIFNQAHEADLTVGRSIDAVADVSVFIAARMTNNIRDIDAWIANAAVDERKFKTTKSVLQTELDVGYEPSKPSDYIDSVIQEFSVSDTTRKKVIELVNQIEETTVHVGKRPRGVVGAAVYLSKEFITQSEVADRIGMSTKTIGKNSRAIQSKLNL